MDLTEKQRSQTRGFRKVKKQVVRGSSPIGSIRNKPRKSKETIHSKAEIWLWTVIQVICDRGKYHTAKQLQQRTEGVVGGVGDSRYAVSARII